MGASGPDAAGQLPGQVPRDPHWTLTLQESGHPQAASSCGRASHAPPHTLPSLSPGARAAPCPPFPHAFPGDRHGCRPAHLCGSSGQHGPRAAGLEGRVGGAEEGMTPPVGGTPPAGQGPADTSPLGGSCPGFPQTLTEPCDATWGGLPGPSASLCPAWQCWPRKVRRAGQERGWGSDRNWREQRWTGGQAERRFPSGWGAGLGFLFFPAGSSRNPRKAKGWPDLPIPPSAWALLRPWSSPHPPSPPGVSGPSPQSSIAHSNSRRGPASPHGEALIFFSLPGFPNRGQGLCLHAIPEPGPSPFFQKHSEKKLPRAPL